jgi:predicted permease
MAHLRRFFRRLTALIRHDRSETELAREISAHLRLIEDKYRARGLGDVEARQAARREFGGVEQAKEHQRDARTFRPLAGASTDVKLGVRMLAKSPGLTIVGVLALAVAIGGGAAYFEFVNDMVRPTLSFPGGDRLVGIVNVDVAQRAVQPRVAWEFARWRRQLRAVQDLGGERPADRNLITDDGRADPVRGVEISASAFRIMPAAPILGRPLVDADEQPGAPHVAVVGYDVWRDRFGGAADVVGRTVRLNEVPHEIVGVMPEGFAFPINYNLWTPLRFDSAGLTRGDGPWLRVFGRLPPGVTLDAAQSELDTLMAGAPDAAAHAHLRPQVLAYVDSLRAPDRMGQELAIIYSLNLIFIALLGLCGANVATLVFARTVTREAELTVRTALGASRGRIVAQLVAEALVLAALAAGVGLLAASFTLELVRGIWIETLGPLPFWWNTGFSTETLLYVAVLVVLAALLVGGVPALKATGRHMQGRLKQAGAGAGTLQFGRLWTGVIVGQVAITVVFLLIVAGLGWEARDANRKFVHVTFPRSEYLTAGVEMPGAMPPERRSAVLRELARRIQSEPAVSGVTYAAELPGISAEQFWVEFPSGSLQAGQARSGDDVRWVRSARVGPGYFDTFGQRIVAGRTFTPSELESGLPVAVVDESFVRRVLGGRSALGQQVRQPWREAGGTPGPWFEIVGVVSDISTSPARKADEAMIYRPLPPDTAGVVSVVIHARDNAAALGSPLRIAAVAVDPLVRLRDVVTLDRAADVEMRTFGYLIRAVVIVSGVALLLSTAGIYALVSFTLARRRREIGIRTALGASPARVIASVLRHAVVRVGIGVAIGALPGGAVLSLQAKEYASGPLTAGAITVAIAAFIIGVAMVSCIVPVRRALRIQPTEALRIDA